MRVINMGFRSLFIASTPLMSEDWPKEFIEKHSGIDFSRGLQISAKSEHKFYNAWEGLDKELQQILKDYQSLKNPSFLPEICLVALHECRGITYFRITPDKIELFEPEGWRKVDEITHWYCYCTPVEEE